MSFGVPVRNGLGIGLLPSTAISTLRIGGRPALFLNFISPTSLDPRVTFTRGTTATFIGSNGLIQSSAIDTPRFEYNPVTLAPKGLLIEEQRTNLLTYSEQANNSAWAKTNINVTADATTSPDGTSTADKLIATTTNALHIIDSSAASFTSGSQYTASVFAKAGELSFLQITFSSAAISVKANFNVQTGVLGTVDGGITAQIISMGNGWYRCVATGTSSGTGSYKVVFGLIQSATSARFSAFAGNNVDGLFFWGAQLEQASFPTSYIPTVAAQVVRNADTAIMTGTNFSSWYAATQGTFVSQFTTSNVSSTATVLDANDATANESIRLRTVTTNPTFTVTDGGVDQANIDAGTVAANTAYKMAGTYAANDFAASISGGVAVTDVSGTLPTVNQLQIGASAAGNILNGCIGSITYYNTRLSNATLRVLTV